MLEIDFSGPFALLPNPDQIPYLLACQDAWGAGVFLWTFLYNQAYRVNYVGIAPESVADRQRRHLADFFAGKLTIYRAGDLREGAVNPTWEPQDGQEEFISAIPHLMAHVAALRVFFAPFSGSRELLERIGTAITAHYHRLGGKAVAWLRNEPVAYDANAYAEPFTLRIGRPAFIASLPDEMHI